MTYRIIIDSQARKDMKKISADIQRRVSAAIDILRENPFAGKRLKGDLIGLWTLRVWPYRILYIVERKIITVTVLEVAHRQGVYQ